MRIYNNKLPVKIEKENNEQKTTSLSGLVPYLELLKKMRLWDVIKRNVHVNDSGQGRTDMEMIISLILLKIAGGTSVSDMERLEHDSGLRSLLKDKRFYGLNKSEISKLSRRWRKPPKRVFSSESSNLNYLQKYHDESEEKRRRETDHEKAFIPSPSAGLRGLNELIKYSVKFAHHQRKETVATLDMDATVIRSHKESAFGTYKGYRGYQPFNVLWSELGVLLYSEFRDGNVPAGYEQLRVLTESLNNLPEGVTKVRVRSDSAGYQHELLSYCEQGKNARFGRIEFAISCDVTGWFRQAVNKVRDEDWHPLYKITEYGRIKTDQEWAEVVYVPNRIGYSKNAPTYRYIAIRKAYPQLELSLGGMEERDSHEVKQNGVRYRVFGIVTNMDWDGEELINWQRKRAGKGEQMQGELKNDLGGGWLPSQKFGANAAWWLISVLAFNINEIMKHEAMPQEYRKKRLKGIRFLFINLSARILRKARNYVLRLGSGKEAAMLSRALTLIRNLSPVPSET